MRKLSTTPSPAQQWPEVAYGPDKEIHHMIPDSGFTTRVAIWQTQVPDHIRGIIANLNPHVYERYKQAKEGRKNKGLEPVSGPALHFYNQGDARSWGVPEVYPLLEYAQELAFHFMEVIGQEKNVDPLNIVALSAKLHRN